MCNQDIWSKWTTPPYMTVKTDPLNQVGSYHSDWSDLDNDKDSQAQAPCTSAPRQDPQPTTSHTRTDAPLKRPNTHPKALIFGRGNIAPLANCFTMGCRHICGHRLNINHPLSQEHPRLVWCLLTKLYQQTGYKHMMRCQPQLDLDML